MIYHRVASNKIDQLICPPQWRRGSTLDCGSRDLGLIPSTPLWPACRPSGGKEVKDAFGSPCLEMPILTNANKRYINMIKLALHPAVCVLHARAPQIYWL